jgi:hypothetical protein
MAPNPTDLILRAARSAASRRMVEFVASFAPPGASFEAASRRLRTRWLGVTSYSRFLTPEPSRIARGRRQPSLPGPSEKQYTPSRSAWQDIVDFFQRSGPNGRILYSFGSAEQSHNLIL